VTDPSSTTADGPALRKPSGRPTSVQVAGSIVVRAPRADEVATIVALNEELFGRQEVPGVSGLLTDERGAEWLVAVDESDPSRPEVAAACARIPHRFALDGIELPGCQIEWVTTAEAHRGRGLVRSLFAAHHGRSAARGELLQLIGGIPYFYRRLGYGYALDAPLTLAVEPDRLVDSPSPVVVRPARPGDVPWLARFDAERARDGLTVVRDASTFERWIRRGGDIGADGWECVLVAEADGDPLGWVRIFAFDREAQLHVLGGWTPTSELAAALLGAACDEARRLEARLGRRVEVLGADAPGTAWSRVLHRCGHQRPEPSGLFGRTPDPVTILRRLTPVLEARLAASGLATDRGELVVSLYERGLRLAWDGPRIVSVEPAPADPEPFEHGGVGVAPDWFPALVLGRWGASELAARVDDVVLGDHAPVMDVLFPRRPADLVVDL
jgi:predicted N-acetyltransferase YhbS